MRSRAVSVNAPRSRFLSPSRFRDRGDRFEAVAATVDLLIFTADTVEVAEAEPA
jgi:hypothetical protein